MTCITFMLSLFGIFFLGNLCFLHLRLAFTNITTKENLNERYIDSKDINPFDKQNCLSNCFEQVCKKRRQSLFSIDFAKQPCSSSAVKDSFNMSSSTCRIFPEKFGSDKPDTQRALAETTERENYKIKIDENHSRRNSQFALRIDESALKTVEERSRMLLQNSSTLERSGTLKQ